MFIAALFPVARTWKQSKCPSMDEWMKMWYTHTDTHTHRHTHRHTHTHTRTGILLSHKKDEILPCVKTWMDLEGIMLNEISQMEKDKYHMISCIC